MEDYSIIYNKQPIFLNSVLLVKLLIKGSYDAIKFSFVFGVLQAVWAYIRSVKLQRIKSQTQRDILYKS